MPNLAVHFFRRWRQWWISWIVPSYTSAVWTQSHDHLAESHPLCAQPSPLTLPTSLSCPFSMRYRWSRHIYYIPPRHNIGAFKELNESTTQCGSNKNDPLKSHDTHCPYYSCLCPLSWMVIPYSWSSSDFISFLLCWSVMLLSDC